MTTYKVKTNYMYTITYHMITSHNRTDLIVTYNNVTYHMVTYREVEKLTSSVTRHIQSPQSVVEVLEMVMSQLVRPPEMRRRGSPLHTWLGTFS